MYIALMDPNQDNKTGESWLLAETQEELERMLLETDIVDYSLKNTDGELEDIRIFFLGEELAVDLQPAKIKIEPRSKSPSKKSR